MKLQRQTPRLILRSADPSDLEAWQRVLVQPSTAPYAYRFSGIPRAQLCLNFQLRQDHEIDSFWLTIFERETQAFVGFCGLSGKGDKVYDAFYYLAGAFMGKGYATEALSEMIRFALITKSRRMVVARIEADNLKSQGVAKRAGMCVIPPIREVQGNEKLLFFAPRSLPLEEAFELLVDAANREMSQQVEYQTR